MEENEDAAKLSWNLSGGFCFAFPPRRAATIQEAYGISNGNGKWSLPD